MPFFKDIIKVYGTVHAVQDKKTSLDFKSVGEILMQLRCELFAVSYFPGDVKGDEI